MTYKLTVIENHLPESSSEIIFNGLVECLLDINDLKDILLLDYWEKMNYKPVINISEPPATKEIIIHVWTNIKNYGRDVFLRY